MLFMAFACMNESSDDSSKASSTGNANATGSGSTGTSQSTGNGSNTAGTASGQTQGTTGGQTQTGGSETGFDKCTDGKDNDGNGFTDCEDWSCGKNNTEADRTYCLSEAENTIEACTDGKDNDLDGYADCRDFDCTNDPERSYCNETGPDLCSDGKDNDQDGFADCKDRDCNRDLSVTACHTEIDDTLCANTKDDDGDDLIDCKDCDCWAETVQVCSKPIIDKINADKAASDHLLFSELSISGAEFVEIFNPTATEVDLSNVYVANMNYTNQTDATKSSYWFNANKNPVVDSYGDFLLKFPSGTKIASKTYLVIALTGSTSYKAKFPKAGDPDFEIPVEAKDDLNTANMEGSWDKKASGKGFLDSRAEDLVLFEWDGTEAGALVDHDSFYWKSSNSKGENLPYLGRREKANGYNAQDQALDIQAKNAFLANSNNYCETIQRILFSEGTQSADSGNGIGGSDQTSENLNETWNGFLKPTPGSTSLAEGSL